MTTTSPTARNRRRRGPSRRVLVAIGFVVLVILAAVAVLNQGGSASAAVKAPATVAVTRGRIVGSVNGNGAIAAAQTVELAFQAAGTVKSVSVNAGDSVQAGQVLAELESSDLQLSLANAQSALNQQQAR